jgi:type IV secretion system protein TrbG
MKRRTVLLILVCSFLCACQSHRQNEKAAPYSLAVKSDSGPQQIKYVPVPLPGQLMPIKKTKSPNRLVGEAAIEAANKKSMKQPNSGEYINSIMTFNYMPGSLYQIYSAPLSVTDIQFQNNEHIIAVGAGDTLRWQVTKTYSGIGASRQEHLLVKPIDEGLTNSLVVTTDLRTYHLILNSVAKTYMASVTWRYPDGEGSMLTNFDENSSDDISDIANSIDVNNLRFNYQVKLVKGSQPDWYPRMVFNDGKKTYVKFSANVQESPTLFVGDGIKNAQVVNYRVQGNYYVVDSLFYYAMLSAGPDKNQTIVQISMKK